MKAYEDWNEFDVLEMPIEKLIGFLYWNDANGCWNEEDDFPPLTLDEAREFAIRYILGVDTQNDVIGYPTENQYYLKKTMGNLATHWVLTHGRDCDGGVMYSVTAFSNKLEAESMAWEYGQWSDGIQYKVTDSFDDVKEYCEDHDLDFKNYM